MSILRRLSILSNIVLFLSSAYVLLTVFRGIGSLLSMSEPAGLGVFQTSLGVMLTVSAGLLAGTIFVVMLIGYLVLTALRGFSRIPLIFKLLASFLAGIVIFVLSMPLGAILPIPFVPTVIVATMLWLMLRTLSRALGSSGDLAITVYRAEEIAQQILQSHLNNVAVSSAGSRLSGRVWKVNFLGSDNQAYEVNVDSRTGATLGWGAVVK
jgi:hypothetical protein